MRRLIALACLLLSACGEAPPQKGGAAASNVKTGTAIKADRSQAGLVAPAAAFLTPEGAPTTLAAFRGKPMLVNFWATWCAPCVKEMPVLDKLAAREAGKLAVVSISQDSDGDDGTAAQKVDGFFKKNRLASLGAYVDAENEVMAQLGLQGLPTTVLYDPAGKEVWRVAGDAEWTGEAAAKLIAEAG